MCFFTFFMTFLSRHLAGEVEREGGGEEEVHAHLERGANVQALGVARVDVAERGTITLAELSQAFSQVGMDPSPDEVEQVLVHLGKEDLPDITLTFAEFSQAADFLSPLEGEE